MVSRRQVLRAFIAIPAVIFANRALAHPSMSRQPEWLTELIEVKGNGLWAQVFVDGRPVGKPIEMEALPAERGHAIIRNTHEVLLPRMEFEGPLEVEVFSGEYGSLGRGPINLSSPVVTECDIVVVSSVVFDAVANGTYP